MNKLFKFLMLVVILQPVVTNAQNIEDLLSKYTSENGKKYMQPFADAFAANMNSGLFHHAKLKKLGVQIYFGLESQIAFIPDKNKEFTATTEGDWFPETTVNDAPTVFGSTEGRAVPHESGLIYIFPGGFDMNYVPLAVPQITLGSVYGTDLTLRYIGTNAIEDFGKIQLFGWGLRHNIDQYFRFPLNLALAYYHQSFKAGDILDAKTNLVQIQTSYSVPIVTFYGGLGFEGGKVNLQYIPDESTGETEEIKYDMKPGNKVRFTLGVGFNFGPFNLHGDYNISKQSTVAFGLGFGIGEK